MSSGFSVPRAYYRFYLLIVIETMDKVNYRKLYNNNELLINNTAEINY